MRRFCCFWMLLGLAVAVAAPVQAMPPAQSVVYVGTEVPKEEGWPKLSLAGYLWQAPGTREISAYVGPRWDFLEDRLGLEIKVGGYAADEFKPVVNVEVLWEDGPLSLGYFGDFSWPTAHYSWLDGTYAFGPLSLGAMADLTWQHSPRVLEAAAGPLIGAGHKGFDVALAPTWDLKGNLTVRVFLSLQLNELAAK